MLDRADCADFGCHNSIRLETKHFFNTLGLTFISFSGRFVFAMLCKNIIFFFASDPLVFLHNTIYRAQLFYPFLLSASEFLSNLLFSYHLLYFCTALFLIIILSSNHLHKSKTLSQLTQCPFTGTLLLFVIFLLLQDFTVLFE